MTVILFPVVVFLPSVKCVFLMQLLKTKNKTHTQVTLSFFFKVYQTNDDGYFNSKMHLQCIPNAPRTCWLVIVPYVWWSIWLHRDDLHRQPRYQSKLSVTWLVLSEHSFVWLQIQQSFILSSFFVQQSATWFTLLFITIINYFWAQLLACNDNIPNLLNHILKVLERFHLIPMQQMIISLLLMLNIQTFLFIFFSNSLSIKPVLNMHIHKRLF